MKILHISVAGICDKFYGIFLPSIQSSMDIYQDLYIPYCADDYNESDLEIISRYELNGIHTIALPIKNKSDRILYHKKINKYKKKLEKILNVKEYNIIHAHSLYSDGGVAYLLHKKYHIPYLVAVRITDLVFMQRLPYLRSYGRKIIENAQTVIFITPDLKKSTKEYLYKKSDFYINGEVLPNGIDDYWHENSRKVAKKRNYDEIRLIQVSRLKKNKHIDETISAVNILKNQGYTVSLDILGTGEELENLKRLISKLELKENVHLRGFVSNKNEIKFYYENNDIFVMPSARETFGLTYIEAMSQGLPIIGISGTGVSGFYKDGQVGYFIKEPNAQMIVESIKKIMSNYSVISNNCINEIQSFNWKAIINRYKEIYSVIYKGDKNDIV